jgi:hypothetical protein
MIRLNGAATRVVANVVESDCSRITPLHIASVFAARTDSCKPALRPCICSTSKACWRSSCNATSVHWFAAVSRFWGRQCSSHGYSVNHGPDQLAGRSILALWRFGTAIGIPG